mmetsp:Transcript_73728/g.190229  ORF Transcript_73728/g.190229 Transcript_73728/m.190229 type:complete len:223 (-) Transcript_73728:1713-2381(-)
MARQSKSQGFEPAQLVDGDNKAVGSDERHGHSQSQLDRQEGRAEREAHAAEADEAHQPVDVRGSRFHLPARVYLDGHHAVVLRQQLVEPAVHSKRRPRRLLQVISQQVAEVPGSRARRRKGRADGEEHLLAMRRGPGRHLLLQALQHIAIQLPAFQGAVGVKQAAGGAVDPDARHPPWAEDLVGPNLVVLPFGRSDEVLNEVARCPPKLHAEDDRRLSPVSH